MFTIKIIGIGQQLLKLSLVVGWYTFLGHSVCLGTVMTYFLFEYSVNFNSCSYTESRGNCIAEDYKYYLSIFHFIVIYKCGGQNAKCSPCTLRNLKKSFLTITPEHMQLHLNKFSGV